MIRIFLIVFLLGPAAALAANSAATRAISDAERAALAPSRAMLEQGKNVASTACSQCHGIDGRSTGEGVPQLAGQRTVYLYRVLQAYQKRERRSDVMNHAAGFLNDEALMAVAAHYASLSPARPADLEAGGAIADPPAAGDAFAGIRDDMKKCDRCHGPDGNSTASGMPSLTSQDPEYFVRSMQAYTDGSRSHKIMEKLVGNLDDETLQAMGIFYAVQEPKRTETTGDGDPSAGRAAAAECAACHGEDGNATAADMPSLAGQDARYFIKAMKAYQDGKRKHQPMFEAVDGLDEDHIADLAAFYAVQEPVRRSVRAPLTTAEWIERCERCHGIDGNSTDPRFPMLAGQDRTYLARALQSYTGTTRENSLMHAMSAPLTEADIGQIADYYASREPRAVVYMQLPCGE